MIKVKHPLLLLLILVLLLPVAANAQSSWYAWAYQAGIHELTLLDAEGDVLSIPGPTHPEEDEFAHRSLAISRDGSWLAMISTTIDQRPMVLFRDLNTGAESVWFGDIGEWAIPTLNGRHTVSTLTFTPDHSLFATGFGNPDAGTWRVLVFNPQDGSVFFQIDQSHPDLQALLQAEPRPVDYVLPVVRLFEETQLHFQLVLATLEGLAEYPAFTWAPGDNRVEASLYDRAFMDIRASDYEMIYPQRSRDPAVPLPESFGPVPPFNALMLGEGQEVWADGDNLILNVRWGADGQVAVVQSQNPDTFEAIWRAIPLENPDAVINLPPEVIDVYGTPDGFLTLDGVTGDVRHHTLSDMDEGAVVATLSEDDNEIIWVLPPDSEYNGPKD